MSKFFGFCGWVVPTKPKKLKNSTALINKSDEM